MISTYPEAAAPLGVPPVWKSLIPPTTEQTERYAQLRPVGESTNSDDITQLRATCSQEPDTADWFIRHSRLLSI